MKKYFLLIVCILLLLCGCSENDKPKSNINAFLESGEFKLENEITDDIELKNSYTFNGSTITVMYESDDTELLSNTGKVLFDEEDSYVSLKVTFKEGEYELVKTFDLTIKGKTREELLVLCSKDINLPNETSDDVTLPARIKYNSTVASCVWTSSDETIISNTGSFNYPESDKEITLSCKLSSKDTSITKSYKIKALSLNKTTYINELAKLSIPNSTDADIKLENSISISDIDYPITWTSSDTNAIEASGKIKYVSEDTNCNLTATIQVKNISVSKEWPIVIKPAGGLKFIQETIEMILIPKTINNDIILPTEMNGVSLQWTSSDSSAIDNTGKINKSNTTYKNVKLTVKLSAGEYTQTEEFDTLVSYEPHMFLDRAFDGTKQNTEIKNGKLVLSDGALSGTYTTKVIDTENFTDVVGSYSATSSEKEVCELKVRLRIGSTWTKYFTYGEFGKGLKNGYSNQTDTKAKMIEDEIKTISPDVANGFQLQLTLKRTSAELTGPIVTLLALAINYSSFSYPFDITNLPKEVKYDLPKLYQHDVPEIGGSICSCTSSTMLLMYKGYSFEGLADYPHQYIAGIVKDYGHNIFGNWSYNCIGMGSFGATAYVKRFYSYGELLFHLANVGPVAASIKGTMITDAKTYTTGGHLIDVTGYKIDGDKIYIYINDPNINVVATRCTLQNFLNVYRNVSYIIE